MCYAVPAIILSVEGENASVDYGGVRKSVNISLLETVQAGEYILIHAGFAIEKVSEERAHAAFSIINSLSELESR